MKAIGASNWQLYRTIFQQALFAAVLGYAVGLGAAFGAIKLVTNVAPAFVTDTRTLDLAVMLGAALLMALVASYVPVRRLVSLDPAIVFKQ